MPQFQGSGLLSLAGSLLGYHQSAAGLRAKALQASAGVAEDQGIVTQTLAEEDRRLKKAKTRQVRARRQSLHRAFGGFKLANPGSSANPAVAGFVSQAGQS